jgi:membrane protease YdiL (CAAX protease family)
MAPVIGVTPAYLNMVFGAPNPTATLITSAPTMLMLFAIRLVNPLDGPIQEELGWRGFALPRLQERHLPLVASAILGVLVVIWHVPLILLGMLPAYALFGTFAFTIVFGWLFNNTQGSVLMTLIAHAADGLVITGIPGRPRSPDKRPKKERAAAGSKLRSGYALPAFQASGVLIQIDATLSP